ARLGRAGRGAGRRVGCAARRVGAPGGRHALGPAGAARRARDPGPDRRARGGPQAAGPAADPLARRRLRARRARAADAPAHVGHAQRGGVAARRVGAGGHDRAPAERVEHAVRRRFPDARIARWEPDAARGARAEAQRAAAAAADVVIGTRGALRLFGPAALGLAAFVAPDQLLRAPDFRAGERALAFAWAAAERVAGDGALLIQSQNPEHYAFEAVTRQDLHAFYQHELKFRAELGYPPFRRLAVVTARAAHADETRRLGEAVAAALRARSGLTVYPPAADRGGRAQRVVAKGDADLPRRLDEALREFTPP